ncbi:MAG: AMP-binding protein, partial [Acidimicrobiia bacterium]
MNVVEMLDARAVEFGERSLFRFLGSGEDWSFAELARRARRVAGQLDGVEPGARVGVLTDDRAAFCDAFFGSHARGVTPVPLGANGTVGSEAWALILRDRVARFDLAAVLTDGGMEADVRTALAGGRTIAVDGDRGDPAPLGPPAPHAFIQPSSGTTGDPKGVVVAADALFANLTAIGAHWELTPRDVGLSWLPLHHDMGLIGTMINAVVQGALLYHWPTASFLRSPGRFLQLVDELDVTLTVAPPFALELITRRQLRRPATLDLTRLRSLLVGAEMIRPEVLTSFAETFAGAGLAPGTLSPTYGLAEATLAVSANPVGRPYRVVDVGARRAVVCGVPLGGVEVATSDAGELLVRSPGLMDGYVDDLAATERAVVDGWLHTGDLATIDDGAVVVLGRIKEMINRGGVRLPASDFELVLAGMEGLLPDRVIAFADGDGNDGEERVVVLAESRWTDRADEAVLAARGRLAAAGLPVDVVELVRPGFIPRTTSGKLRRVAA